MGTARQDTARVGEEGGRGGAHRWEEEREEREKGRQELINKLESSDKDAAKLVARARAEAQRRTSARSSSSTFQTSTKLRPRAAQAATVPDVPHVPLQDDWYAYEDKYTVRDDYDDPISEAVRRDREGVMRAGGYRVQEVWERALRYAVAGLEIKPLSGLHVTNLSAEDPPPAPANPDAEMVVA